QLMGDAKDKLTGVIMHSATETQLRKNNLIQTELDSNNKPISLFMEKRVIIDDSCPTSVGEYTTYLFGEGAIGLGNGGAPVPTETDRDSLAGDDILINRKHYILHPRGVKWIGSAAGSSPTNAELATGTNWSRVYEDKAIRMVKFVHKL
ncbi:major capsid protein, partial [Clostridium neonatale]|uniref:major capsid protein n=1 Tax=Clostridium neonatale TaxID=137838 RepID=UPI0029371987